MCLVLLAMLVLGEPDRRVSRKVIAADLWPDDDAGTAAGKLRRHLSLLVSAAPELDAWIGRDGESLWLRAEAAFWCDVVSFQRGDLELCGGEFLEGVTHEWVDTQRQHLRALALEGLVNRAETQREDDDYAGAIASVRRALEIDPCHEPAAQLEIELHGERGDLPALDTAFAVLKQRLRELDAKPSAETEALVERFHERARSAAARIPKTRTSFVEPQRLDDVAALVPAHRLVTIAGPGGAGKTRLALETAHRLASTFPDGAYFADLSTVSEGDALPDALSRSLGVPTDLARDGFSGIMTMLRNRRALFVLDNCEQIVESCSWFLNELLDAAPHVHVIATSREAFGLGAERCYALRALSETEAVRLFIERARSAGWGDIEVSAAGSRVSALCDRLDRLPLALELAASMLGALPLGGVERQIDEGLERLRSRDTTAPERHQSLDDVIAWSVSLLAERERGAFARLSVFCGSFSAEAAEAICGVDLTTLAKLVSKSVLVRADAVDSRFVFLNSIAEYARRLFEADPRAAEIRDAHAAWYARVAMRSDEIAFWKRERTWLGEIDRDFGNVTQALDWSLFDGGVVQNGIHLATGIAHYCFVRGFQSEGVVWLDAAVERSAPDSVERANLEYRLSVVERWRARFEKAHDHARKAVDIFSRAGPERDLARALNQRAATLLFLGRAAEVRPLLERALPLARRAGDLRLEAVISGNLAFLLVDTQPSAARELYLQTLRLAGEAGDEGLVAGTLNNIAANDYLAERYDAASERLERALAIYRTLGNEVAVAGVVSDLGDVALMRNEPSLARSYYAEALAFIEERESTATLPFALSGVAGLAAAAGRPRDGARLLGASRLHQYGARTGAGLRVRNHVLALLERTLGADACAFEMSVGSEFAFHDAVRLARSVLRLTAS
jgi:non-specific serine/threonine protein kinase